MMNGNGGIRYDQMMEDALRGIIRTVLRSVEEDGLPGMHHFYISFKTKHPEVDMPEFLAEKYTDEMTIVLQHQFWDLFIAEDHFKITLSFSKVPCTLTIPFSAITGFADPSVEFGLQFHSEEDFMEEDLPLQTPLKDLSSKEKAPAKKTKTAAQKKASAPAKKAPAQKKTKTAKKKSNEAGQDNIVDLSSFRKKK
ncbi:MAG: SspB family protein [Alphaproteobacteria bacterium]